MSKFRKSIVTTILTIVVLAIFPTKTYAYRDIYSLMSHEWMPDGYTDPVTGYNGIPGAEPDRYTYARRGILKALDQVFGENRSREKYEKLGFVKVSKKYKDFNDDYVCTSSFTSSLGITNALVEQIYTQCGGTYARRESQEIMNAVENAVFPLALQNAQLIKAGKLKVVTPPEPQEVTVPYGDPTIDAELTAFMQQRIAAMLGYTVPETAIIKNYTTNPNEVGMTKSQFEAKHKAAIKEQYEIQEGYIVSLQQQYAEAVKNGDLALQQQCQQLIATLQQQNAVLKIQL